MEKYDVIIVGAGPAGSTAAYYTTGLKVLIIDKSDFPRHKACGGGLMSSRDWPLELENYAKIKDQLTAYSCESLKLYWKDDYLLNRHFKHFFDQISRYQFDNLLLEEALKKDNVTFLKFDLQKIEKTNYEGIAGYTLTDGQRKIFATNIVGADGMHSQVAKFLGNPPLKRHAFGYCLECDIVCEKKDLNVYVVAGYLNEIGYGWIFPTATGYQVGVGIVRKPKHALQYYLNAFIERALKKKILPENYVIEKTFGGALPLKVTRTYCTDNVLLCGDAMGLVKLLTGEGIYYAMLSGKFAGLALSQNRSNLKKFYRKKVRPLIWDTYLTPYIPPKIITLTFGAIFFRVVKFFDRPLFLRKINIFVDIFMRLTMHRKKFQGQSFYRDEKITIEKY
ncbi:MAG: geranylgeranyl reductase family protein [Candidatus Moranbacteria bacterium]|nr:geranylgeranyl reductase family protein [Candidatus Moranbacteria bacterium]